MLMTSRSLHKNNCTVILPFFQFVFCAITVNYFAGLKGAVSYFTHNKLESVGPTFSSSESKMAPSNEGEHGGKRDNSGRKKAPR